jgi:hypothetical protein
MPSAASISAVLPGPCVRGPRGAPGGQSGCAMMLLAAGSELCDELLCLVELAPEPVPPLGRALRERLARVAGVQLADRRHALSLCGPELLYGRPPLRLGALAARSRSPPDEFHFPGRLPAAGVVIQRAHSHGTVFPGRTPTGMTPATSLAKGGRTPRRQRTPQGGAAPSTPDEHSRSLTACGVRRARGGDDRKAAPRSPRPRRRVVDESGRVIVVPLMLLGKRAGGRRRRRASRWP